MAGLNPPAAVEEQSPEANETNEQTSNDFAERLSKLEEDNKRLQGSISAKDKSLAALQKEKDELAKSVMTEEERIKAERKAEHEKNVETYLGLKKKELSLDDGFEALLGNDYDSIDGNATLLQSFAEKITAGKDAKISELETELAKWKAGTGDPGRGDPTDGETITLDQYNKKSPKERASFMAAGGKIKA